MSTPLQVLPELVVVEILSGLRVKDVLRFRCVCKSWKSLIDSPMLMKAHLCNNSEIYVFCGMESEEEIFFKLEFAEVDLLKCPDRLLVESLTLVRFSSGDHIQVVGSCDGLICLSNRLFKKIVLVSPSTREYKLLPPINVQENECAFGFGYESSADEYKVVIIPEKKNEAYIYGSKSNTWRQVDASSEHKTDIGTFRGGCYTHGCLHWIVTFPDQNPETIWIVAFDLKTEKFTATKYDPAVFGSPGILFEVGLWAIGEKLWLSCETDRHEGCKFHHWVMKVYGVRESWSKVASFDEYVHPIAFSNCRRRLLLELAFGSTCGCVYHWYDLDGKSMECIDTSLERSYHACMQSLIRLESKLT